MRVLKVRCTKKYKRRRAVILGMLISIAVASGFGLGRLFPEKEEIPIEVKKEPSDIKEKYIKPKKESIEVNLSEAFPQVFNITAYTLGEDECGKAPDHPQYGITASGKHVKEWYTLAGPKSLPFGTVVYIPYFKDYPNSGIFVVEDRGGAITEGHLDIFMHSKKEAIKFGRQNLNCFVFKGSGLKGDSILNKVRTYVDRYKELTQKEAEYITALCKVRGHSYLNNIEEDMRLPIKLLREALQNCQEAKEELMNISVEELPDC